MFIISSSLFVLLSIISILFGKECGRLNYQENRIVGGRQIQNIFPWFGTLYKNGKLLCGSALISSQYVITAAHCAYEDIKNPTSFEVLFRATNRCHWNESQIIEKVNKIIIHQDYNDNTGENDISLIKLKKRVDFMPVCLPNKDFQFKKSGLIMGFGTLRYGNIGYPCMLHEAEINIYPIRMCKSIVSYPKQINGIWNIICAGELNGSKDACQGDSGGPLVVTSNNVYYILGIISAGIECARPNLLGIYVNTPFYLNWIKENMK